MPNSPLKLTVTLVISCALLAVEGKQTKAASPQRQQFYGCWERATEFKWDGKVPDRFPPDRKPFPWRLGYCFSANGKFRGYDFEGGWAPHGADLGGEWKIQGGRLMIVRDGQTDHCRFTFNKTPKALVLSNCRHAGVWGWQRDLKPEWGE